MRKKYRVKITNKAIISIDVDKKLSENELLDIIESEMNKGYIVEDSYFEIEGEEINND